MVERKIIFGAEGESALDQAAAEQVIKKLVRETVPGLKTVNISTQDFRGNCTLTIKSPRSNYDYSPILSKLTNMGYVIIC